WSPCARRRHSSRSCLSAGVDTACSKTWRPSDVCLRRRRSFAADQVTETSCAFTAIFLAAHESFRRPLQCGSSAYVTSPRFMNGGASLRYFAPPLTSWEHLHGLIQRS